MVRVSSMMNVSRLTLSWRWLSSASFSVASSSIASSCAAVTRGATHSAAIIQRSGSGGIASGFRLGRCCGCGCCRFMARLRPSLRLLLLLLRLLLLLLLTAQRLYAIALLQVKGAHKGQREIQCLRSSEFNLLKEHTVADGDAPDTAALPGGEQSTRAHTHTFKLLSHCRGILMNKHLSGPPPPLSRTWNSLGLWSGQAKMWPRLAKRYGCVT